MFKEGHIWLIQRLNLKNIRVSSIHRDKKSNLPRTRMLVQPLGWCWRRYYHFVNPPKLTMNIPDSNQSWGRQELQGKWQGPLFRLCLDLSVHQIEKIPSGSFRFVTLPFEIMVVMTSAKLWQTGWMSDNKILSYAGIRGQSVGFDPRATHREPLGMHGDCSNLRTFLRKPTWGPTYGICLRSSATMAGGNTS